MIHHARGYVVLAVAVLIAVAAATAASAGEWQDIGPGGFDLRAVSVHPSSADTMYAAECPGVPPWVCGGVYFTADGGRVWGPDPDIPSDRIVFDPVNPSVRYALSYEGLYKSADGGGEWRRIAPHNLRCLAFDPTNTHVLYAGSESSVLRKSEDGGETWEERDLGSVADIGAILVDPFDPNTICVGMAGWQGGEFAGDWVYRSTDGGETWTHIPSELHTSIECMVADPTRSGVCYLSTAGAAMYSSEGVFKSLDGGATWFGASEGLPEGDNFWSFGLAMDPAHPDTICAACYYGLYRTTDGAEHWTQIPLPEPNPIPQGVSLAGGDPGKIVLTTYRGVMLSTDGGGSFSYVRPRPGVQSILVDRGDPSAIHAIASRGLYQTHDAGQNWSFKGYGTARWDGVAQDPGNPDVIFMARGRTQNGGADWDAVPLEGTINAYAIAPGGVVYAGGVDEAAHGVVYRSRDEGDTWETVSGAIATTIAVDPQRPLSVFVGGVGAFQRSDDGGDTWTYNDHTPLFPSNDAFVSDIAFDPAHPATVYCAVFGGGLFRSVDRGDHWTRVDIGVETPYIRAIEADPDNPSRLFAATWKDGLFASTDHGDSWTRLTAGPGNGMLYRLDLSPASPGVLYACGSASNPGLWRYDVGTTVVAFTGIDVERGNGFAAVHWRVRDVAGIEGFDVQRADRGSGEFVSLTPSPLPADAAGTYVDRAIEAGVSYAYRVVAVTAGGDWPSPRVEAGEVSFVLELQPNHPNPFNPSTTISFVLPRRGPAEVTVYDVTGARVVTLARRTFDPGLHTVTWDGSDGRGNAVGAGVYFCRLTSGRTTLSRKMVLVK